jgi:hypothetical protein
MQLKQIKTAGFWEYQKYLLVSKSLPRPALNTVKDKIVSESTGHGNKAAAWGYTISGAVRFTYPWEGVLHTAFCWQSYECQD